MHTINAYYYYVNDSPIGNIVFYATDDQNAEDKFRRLVARKLSSNSFINTDKYRIEKYPYNKLHHSDYQMITRLPERIKSVIINILNDPSSRNDQSGWYVLWQNKRVIAQDFFKDRIEAIKSFTNNSCLENDCEQYLLHKQYTVTGPFKSGVKMNKQPTKKSEPTLFEVQNIIKEEVDRVSNSLLSEGNPKQSIELFSVPKEYDSQAKSVFHVYATDWTTVAFNAGEFNAVPPQYRGSGTLAPDELEDALDRSGLTINDLENAQWYYCEEKPMVGGSDIFVCYIPTANGIIYVWDSMCFYVKGNENNAKDAVIKALNHDVNAEEPTEKRNPYKKSSPLHLAWEKSAKKHGRENASDYIATFEDGSVIITKIQIKHGYNNGILLNYDGFGNYIGDRSSKATINRKHDNAIFSRRTPIIEKCKYCGNMTEVSIISNDKIEGCEKCFYKRCMEYDKSHGITWEDTELMNESMSIKKIIKEEFKNISSLLNEDDAVLNAPTSTGQMILNYLKKECNEIDFNFFTESDYMGFGGVEKFADHSSPIIGTLNVNENEGVPIDIVLIIGGDGLNCILDVIIDGTEHMKTNIREEDIIHLTEHVYNEIFSSEDREVLVSQLQSLGFNTL